MKMIATTSHVSQASIYNYFGSKEELVNACVDMVLEDMQTYTDEILSNEQSFQEKLKEALLICTSKLNESVSELLSSESMQDSKFKELLIQSINHHKRLIYQKFIESGIRSKDLNTDISVDLYLEYIDAINTIGSSPNSKIKNNQDVVHIQNLFLYGLLGVSE